MQNYRIHLENPAYQWDNATPLGNGAQGIMLYGTVAHEKLALNEESIWAGGPMDTKIPDYKEHLAEIRRLFLENKEWEADQYAHAHMQNTFFRIQSYEYAGEVHVALHDDDFCTEYRRDLDLNTGIASVHYTKDNIQWHREAFASHPAGLMAVRFTASASFSAAISYTRENIDRLQIRENCITADCHTAEGDHTFRVCIQVETDGNTTPAEHSLEITEANTITLYIFTATSFKHTDLCAAVSDAMCKAAKGWDTLLAEHIRDFTALMERSEISFGDDPFSDMPIPERLARLKADPAARDNGLMALYYQFGKYLLISSSREDTLPANLQGVWADGLQSPWNADYHININLQMNYWHAEQANLPECTQALFTYMNEYLLPGGKRTAAENYGARGMVAHHLSDIYGFTAVADGLVGLWPLGGAWLAYHMWEHYLYNGDTKFLAETAYEYIRQCALFFMDTLFDNGNGGLLSGPSISPENRYKITVDGEEKSIWLSVSPTMDTEIIGGLLDMYAETEKILGIHPDDGKIAAEMRAKLPPLQVGKHGQLMEWLKDYDEIEPGHRHISHAFGLYPAAQITRATPDLYQAIRVTLDRRLSSGGGHTGWSRAWLINLFARLRDGVKTVENIHLLFAKSTLDNLFDTHAPFQIDGNFGGTAGIGEMVMQSHEGLISLLPAVPSELSNGYFTGLRARGGYIVDAVWQNGIITSFTIHNNVPLSVDIEVPGYGVYKDTSGKIHTADHGMIHCASADSTITFTLVQ